MKKILLVIILIIVNSSLSMAQCAMCRAVVGSNLSEGRGVIGTGINDGILLMLFFTYFSIPALIFVWYRTAKKEMRLKLGKVR